VELNSIILGADSTSSPGQSLTPSPPPVPPDAAWISALIIGWLVLAFLVAKTLGAFRRRLIVGPPRLGPEESPWSLVFIFFSGASVAMLAAKFVNRQFPTDPDLGQLLLGVAIEALACCFIIGLTIFYRRDGLQRLGLRPIQIPRGIAVGATTLFIMFPVVLVVGQLTELAMRRVGLPAPQPHEVLRSLRGNHGKLYDFTAIGFAVIGAPFFEELAFRGFLQTVIAEFFHWVTGAIRESEPLSTSPEAGSRWLAVITTASLFAAIHKEPAFFPPLFILALGLGYLYERTGNLWATISTHALFNALQVALFLGLTS
jgi:membrane protease YdiL (CAAX protease family)